VTKTSMKSVHESVRGQWAIFHGHFWTLLWTLFMDTFMDTFMYTFMYTLIGTFHLSFSSEILNLIDLHFSS
jgi:hypothetical protein